MTVPFNKPVVCPRLIGRTHDLAALHSLVEDVKSGQGRTALVSGEAGIGKSRLAKEVKTYATNQGFLLLQGNCFQADSSFPYAPLRDLLRTHLTNHVKANIDLEPYVHDLSKLLPDLPLLLPHLVSLPSQEVSSDPEQEKRRIFSTLTHFFTHQAVQQPVVCVIEDLHWCDDTTLEFLFSLTRRCSQQSLFFLFMYRSDEVQPALRRFLAQLNRERLAQEFLLSYLSRDDIHIMLQAIFALQRPVLADTLDAIYTLTEGNPFFIEEILKSLVTTGEIFYDDGTWKRKTLQELSIPQSVQDAVQQRTDHLSPPAKQVLTFASVAGRRFDFALLQRVMHCDEEQLLVLIKELIAAQLVIEESAERFAFRHALTQQAIYGNLLTRERRALHRTMTETIEELHGTSLQDAQVADLAYHFYKAGVWVKALEYGQRAGEKALALYAPRAAVEHLSRALDAAQRQAIGSTAELYLMRGKAYDTLGEFEHARSDFQQALEGIHATRDVVMEWQCLMDFGFLWAGRDYTQAGVWFQRALDVAQTLDTPTLHARSLNRVGNWLVNIGRPDEGLQEHQAALEIFERQQDIHGIAETLDLVGMGNLLYGDVVNSVKQYERAVALLRDIGDNKILASSLTTCAICESPALTETTFSTLTMHDVCIQQLTEALYLARQGDWPADQAFAEMDFGFAHIGFGEFGEALAHLQRALRIATEIEHQQWLAGIYCALTQLYCNMLQPDLAIQRAEEGMVLARQLGSLWWSHNIAAYHALSYMLKKEYAQAEALLSAVMPREEQPHHLAARRVAWAWGRLSLAKSEPEVALRIAEQLLKSIPNAANVSFAQPIPHLLMLKGEALIMLQRFEEATQALQDAKRGAQERQDPSIVWKVHYALGRIEKLLKHEDGAQHEFSAAREIIGSLATRIDDEALRTHFLQTALKSLPKEKSLSPRRAEAERFGGLTERERTIAVLIAQGKSNRDIADALVVSERTVETHVSNIFFKLGYSSRAQIAAWSVEKGL
jgi:DNA-binding CsgD family transcriptional regulator/tetratricopeptide (TPR) repeat protein